MRVLMLMALAAWAVGATTVVAAPPPAAAFARLEAIQDAAISPDGSRVALLGGPAGARSLNIATLDTADNTSLPLGDVEAVDIRWAGNDYVVVRVRFYEKLAQRRDYEFERNIVVDLQGEPVANLMSNDHASRYLLRQSIVRVVDEPRPEIYVMSFGWQFRMSLWRVDPATGHGRIVENGGHSTDYIEPDSTGEARVLLESDDDEVWVRARPKGSTKWTKIWSQEPETGEGYYLGYSDPEDAVYFTERRPDGYQVVRHRLATGAIEPVGQVLAHEPRLLRDPVRGLALGISAGAEKPVHYWLDDEIGGVHRQLSAAFPGQRVSFYNWSLDRTRYVFSTSSPDHPPNYYLFDSQKREVSRLGSAYPELEGAAFGTTRWITYKARDGLEIPAYVTMPPGDRGGAAPLVVLPHGGPSSRDVYAFDWLTQFLATRGYVVLRPQYRGSTGFGLAFEKAGHAEWAGKIQTDILDGVTTLAGDGVIDPDRVCIVGWSFGGYSALTSAFQYPEAYRCAGSVAGLSDLQMLQLHMVRRAGRNSGSFGYLRKALGNAGRDNLRAGSPINQVDRFAIPVLLVHGALDTTVQIEHSEYMRNAMVAAGKDVQFIRLDDDNHNLYKAANRLTMLDALAVFLSNNLNESGVTNDH
ncbi:MAG: S9 family peptidase [Phenylobacterium sp.]|nr:S9 family peptidase [Phenylobacterium sp.]